MALTFQLVEPAEVEIAGVPSAGMTIRAAGRKLGRLRGFVIEGTHQRVRYLVVRSGFLRKSTLVPYCEPRVDLEDHAIDVDVDDTELRQLRDFTPDRILTA